MFRNDAVKKKLPLDIFDQSVRYPAPDLQSISCLLHHFTVILGLGGGLCAQPEVFSDMLTEFFNPCPPSYSRGFLSFLFEDVLQAPRQSGSGVHLGADGERGGALH